MVKIGFSLGYLNGLGHAKALLSYLTNRNIKRVRVYQPFIKGFDTDIDKIVSKIDFLLNELGFEDVLLCISGEPFSWLKFHDVGSLSKSQQKSATFANRFAPYNITVYGQFLASLRDKLDSKKLLGRTLIEFANEPNTGRYYWGGLFDFLSECMCKYSVFQSMPAVYVGGYSSSLLRDKTYKGREMWINLIDQLSLYEQPNAGFSHSFYWQDSGGMFNTVFNSYPIRKFNDIIVSEYNYATSAKEGSEKWETMNSPLWAWYFFRFLKFAESKGVSRVYIHTLVADGREGSGSPGFWTIQFSGGQRQYVPRPAWNYFLDVWSVIDRGYQIDGNKLVGVNQYMDFQEDGSWVIKNK